MKKINKIILMFVLILPVLINASTYDVEVGKANNLLNKDNYINTYEKYIKNGSNIKFEFSDNTNKVNTSFEKGGFISLDEFNLTTIKGVSYLFDGVEYWTLSKNESYIYAITYDNMNTPKNKNANYNGRVTEFVNPAVTVHGEGKINNPWTFDPMYKVTAVVDNRYATIEGDNDQYVKGGCTTNECTAKIIIREKPGFRYITNDCNGTYDNSTETFSVNNLKRDTKCKVTFGKGVYTVTLDKGTPNKIYLKHGENYYKDNNTNEIIRRITSVTPNTGYSFIGYFYNGHKIINGDKEPNSSNNKKILYDSVTGKYITSNVTLSPSWQANEYTISFNCNGGNTPPATQIATYDSSFTLTSSVCTKSGYKQTGWNTRADGTGESWTTSNKTNITWKTANNVELYAVWITCPAGDPSCTSDTDPNCPAGNYYDTTSKRCELCPNGYYCSGGSNKTACPAGYKGTGTGKTTQANGCDACPNGTYSENAGSTTCTLCPAGYMGTGSGKTSETSACTICPAGTFSNELGATSCSTCVAGTYNLSSGQTYCSSCEDGYYCTGGTNHTPCPAGYMGRGTNKTSQANGCSACPEGTYSDTIASTTCSSCPSDSYNTGTGNSTCNPIGPVICDSGKYLNDATGECEPCPAGYYCPSGYIYQCPAGTYTDTTGNTSCDTCPAGTYNDTTGNTSCSTCPNGYYCTGGTNKSACPAGSKGNGTGKTSKADGCSLCPAGTFNDELGSTSCSTCIAGTYNTTSGHTYCSTCEDGYYCTGGSNHTGCPAGTEGTGTSKTSQGNGCSACSAGTFNEFLGQESCYACLPGTYNTSSGQTYCSTCEDGYYCTGGTNHTACPAGYKGTGTGKTSQANGCSACPEGTYSDTEASTTCKSCTSGTYNTGTGNNTCTPVGSIPCTPGEYFSDATNKCEACPAGSYCPGGYIVSCPPGTYTNTTGNTSCTTCTAGTYNETTGNTSCSTCPNGYYCTGGKNKSACPAGSKGTGTGKTSQSNGCSLCPAGTFNDELGSTTCTTCTAGTYTSTSGHTSCSTCEDGYYCTGGTNHTGCPAGTEGTGRGKTSESNGCSLCLMGSYTDTTGNASCTTCRAGTYNEYSGNTNCAPCRNGYYCEGGNVISACPAGYKGTGTGKTSQANGCEKCPAGTYSENEASTTCTSCSPGKYTSTDGETICTPCPPGYVNDTDFTRCKKSCTNSCTSSTCDMPGCSCSCKQTGYVYISGACRKIFDTINKCVNACGGNCTGILEEGDYNGMFYSDTTQCKTQPIVSGTYLTCSSDYMYYP